GRADRRGATPFISQGARSSRQRLDPECGRGCLPVHGVRGREELGGRGGERDEGDRKSTRLNSSHVKISYAVFCLKKKNISSRRTERARSPYTHVASIRVRATTQWEGTIAVISLAISQVRMAATATLAIMQPARAD